MIPKYFDAHAHLNMQFEQDWQAVGRRTIKDDTWFVNVGADEKSSRLALSQVKELDEGAWATVGIHPTEGGDSNFRVIKELARDGKVVAIGECGLEYFKIEDEAVKQKQRELFIKHLELALEVDKPLMIHCRAREKSLDAYDDIFDLLKSYHHQAGNKLRFNMHFFTGNWETAQKFLTIGGYLSFPGIITFSNQYDEIIKNMPLDRIMAETDAPFATPVPYRGQRNEPAYVQFVAERLAELRPESREEVLSALVSNSKDFYRLN